MGHIQMPHPPYLFNAQGEALILGTQCENCYINYLQFFNNQIIRAIDGFDGTVIIMSDHGWGADEQGWWDTMTDEDVYNRFATFVATNDASIDPNVSSVNIMRQVFDMPLLEDRAFMSQYQQSYNFKEVTNVINEFEESKMTMGFENFDDYYKDMRDNVAGITPPPVPVPVIEEPVIEEPEPVIPSNTQHATVENAQGSSTPGCEVTNECFIPSSISLKSAPAMVTFVNNDSAAHTSTAGTPADGPSGAWDSSLIMNGSSYSFTLSNDGVYPYFCMVHPWMTGTIVVGDGNEP
jgi:plastocyanin